MADADIPQAGSCAQCGDQREDQQARPRGRHCRCEDCGVEWTHLPKRGRTPGKCPECRLRADGRFKKAANQRIAPAGATAALGRPGRCVECGVDFLFLGERGAVPARCVTCRQERHANHYSRRTKFSRKCPQCGRDFETTTESVRHCSVRCGTRSHQKQRTRESLERRRATCEVCGTKYLRKTDRATFACSKVCAGVLRSRLAERLDAERAVYKRWAARWPKPNGTECAECGNALFGRRIAYCGDECMKAATARRYRALAAERFNPESRKCKYCASMFAPEYGTGRRVFCSTQCAKKHHDSQRGDHGKNHRKRARHFGVAYDPVDPEKVFWRDGWRCQICGIRTPQSKRGSTHDNAPELDHCTPMALGGPHTYANTQCACRKCNMKKGARMVPSQAPLFEAQNIQ